MKIWIRTGLAAGVLAAVGALAPAARAGCGSCATPLLGATAGYFTDVGGCGGCGAGGCAADCCGAGKLGKGKRLKDLLGLTEVEPLAEPAPVLNDANLYPDGGFTAYPGEAGTEQTPVSNYSPIAYTMPPQGSAQSVRNRLQALGIPLVNPAPQFLGVNPRATEGLILPQPRRQAVPMEQPDKDGDKDKDKDKKDKDKDD
jgi:hypothetical protein